MKKIVAGLVVASVGALMAFTMLEKTDYTTADISNGKEKYLTYCLSCHGGSWLRRWYCRREFA